MVEGIVAVVGIVAVGVDFGLVHAFVEEVEIDADAARGLVGDTGDIPFSSVAGLSGDDIVFANFAGKRHGLFKISGDIANEFEEIGEAVFVDEGAVGSHSHTRIDGDKVSDLAGDGSGNALHAVHNVENAIGVVHATRE